MARLKRANVLLGAALHAADRLGAGEPATDLEQMLLRVLRSAVSDEEIKGWGQVYREAVTARDGRLAGIPEVLTGRPVSQGYSLADWAQDLRPAGEEWLAQSNTALIDSQALAGGGEFDSPEFIEGMREWGFAVSASDPVGWATGRQQEPERDDERAASEWVQVEFENFHVHREVGDGWPNSRDEIRWLSGGSSATATARPFMSREWGGEEARRGKTPQFPPFYSQREVFNGPAGTGLALNIDCWEWDTGDGNNHSIEEALRDFNRDVMLSTAWSVIMELSGVGILAFLSDITFLALNFLGWIAKNDLSCRRAFFLDRYDLALLARGDGRLNWHFNGDGHHELRVKITTSMPFPTGTLEYLVHNGLSWGTPVSLSWTSMSAPALASYAGTLHALFVRPSDQRVLWTRLVSGTWTEPTPLLERKSLLAPALAVFDGKLHAVHAGLDGRLYHSRYDGTSWSGGTAMPHGKTHKAGPGLGANARQMVLAHVEASELSYDRLGTVAGWQNPYEFPFGWKTKNPVSLTASDKQVYKAIRTLNNRVAMTTEMSNSPSGFPWARTDAPTREVTCGPTVVRWQALWILMRAKNGILVAARRNGDSWPWKEFTVGPGNIKPVDEVAAAIHLGGMYVMYRR